MSGHPVEYEDTVQPEIAPCAGCGVLVDELDAEFDGDERRCGGCVEDREREQRTADFCMSKGGHG